MSIAINGEITIKSLDQTRSITFTPQTAKLDFDSLASEDSGRTDTGVMVVEFIKSRYRKVSITLMPSVSYGNADFATILDIVQGRVYYISYDDPIKNEHVADMRVYTSKSNCTLYSGTLNGGTWTGGAFNAIEMDGEE